MTADIIVGLVRFLVFYCLCMFRLGSIVSAWAYHNGISWKKALRSRAASRLLSTAPTEGVSRSNGFEFKVMRGTPEILKEIKSMVDKSPGIASSTELYCSLYDFKLDQFQKEGLEQLMSGRNVIVCTPTGSGKTIVSELAIYYSLTMGKRVFYTTPLKALSNQKFNDFKNRFGVENVGLLTGDISINRDASLVVMTTEVFRNIIFEEQYSSYMSDVFLVCFDEFHYMSDKGRGTVWEESILTCPKHVRILTMSATMGNVENIRQWISKIHNDTVVVQSNIRPVPLQYFYALSYGLRPFFRNRNAGPGAIDGLYYGGKDNDKLSPDCLVNSFIQKEEESSKRSRFAKLSGMKGAKHHTRFMKGGPSIPYLSVVDCLYQENALPAIMFLFSRNGCEKEAKSLAMDKALTRLLTIDEVEYVDRAIALFLKAHPEIPVSSSAIDMLRKGISVHHAGLIPIWKSFVEELFNTNKIKVLFATETLAAGVNMPARTTVISNMRKPSEDGFRDLTTSEFLQMAGRAGRRGMDTIGSVVILNNDQTHLKRIHRIITSPPTDIQSHFQASYGLAVRLVSRKSLNECKRLIERSFGAYLLEIKKSDKIEHIKSKKQSHIKSKIKYNATSNVDQQVCIEVISKYKREGVKTYLQLCKNFKHEQTVLDQLVSQKSKSDRVMVEEFANHIIPGWGLLLKDGILCYFLGYHSRTRKRDMFSAITSDGEYLVFDKKMIMDIYANDGDVIDEASMKALDKWCQSYCEKNPKWDGNGKYLEKIKKRIQEQIVNKLDNISNDDSCTLEELETVESVLNEINEFTGPSYFKYMSNIERQRAIVSKLQKSLNVHPVVMNKEGDLVIAAMKFISTLENPDKFINLAEKVKNGTDSSGIDASRNGDAVVVGQKKNGTENYDTTLTDTELLDQAMSGKRSLLAAWRKFALVIKILQEFNALNTDLTPTPLGNLVGQIMADNELFVAMALSKPGLSRLTPVELSGVFGAIVEEPRQAKNLRVDTKPSQAVEDFLLSLEPEYSKLSQAQTKYNVDFPLNYYMDVAGLVESWTSGVSWIELTKLTSLDQGDISRLLRRTADVLRQVSRMKEIPERLARRAGHAAHLMNRFPNSTDDSNTESITQFLDTATEEQINHVLDFDPYDDSNNSTISLNDVENQGEEDTDREDVSDTNVGKSEMDIDKALDILNKK